MSKKSSEPSPTLTETIEQAIEAVLKEREQKDSPLNLFDLDFPKQTAFIQSPGKRKALWCTRRAAKSYTAGLYLMDTAQKFHEVDCLYLGLTKDSAMGIMWNPILRKIERNHNLGMNFRESKRNIQSVTGSNIYLSGADADAEEMHKLLGKKYKLVIIDEAQSFTVDMRTLVYGILGPTLVDQNGTICLMGTSGNLVQGLFYDVTTGKEPGWDLFQWTAHDNPYVAKQWQEELDEIARTRPAFQRTSLYKQWYLNQWVIDDDAKVYRFSDEKNCAPSLSHGLADWTYVLGVDLAHSPDSTAFVVGAYHPASPELYLIYAKKAQKLDITDVATTVRQLEARYHFAVKIIDGANKQAVAELNNRHDLNFLPADKTGKSDFITLMNDDFIQGKIKLLPDTEPLREEYRKLIWLTDANGKIVEPKKENPVLHNDLADAALYLWRYCYQYLFKPPEPWKDRSKQEVWEPAHIAKLQEQVRREQNPDELEVEWDEAFGEFD